MLTRLQRKIMKDSSTQSLRKRYQLLIAASSSLLILVGLTEFCTAKSRAQSQPLPLPKAQATQIIIKNAPVKSALTSSVVNKNSKLVPAVHSNAPWHTVTVKHGDSLEKIFKHSGVNVNQVHEILNQNKANKVLNHIKPGQTMQLQTSPQHQLLQLKYSLDNDKMLWVQRASEGFKTVVSEPKFKQERAKLTQSRYSYVGGTIHHSLNETARSVGMNYAMTNQLTRIFSPEINFRRIQPGDHFSLIYKPGNPSEIVAAEFNTRGTAHQAVRYTDGNGHTCYYNPQGRNFQSAGGGLSRFPVQYKRISSGFSYRRFDPVLHRVHQHLGVDLAAPRGTPIKSIGDGRIKFIGRKGGYGNAVVIQYAHNYQALFGHMSQFTRGLRTNSAVRQGQVIGYVGSTGFATGPHVHYEVHVNGVPRDPLKVALPPSGMIEGKDRLRFLNQAKSVLAELQLSQRSQLAANSTVNKIK